MTDLKQSSIEDTYHSACERSTNPIGEETEMGDEPENWNDVCVMAEESGISLLVEPEADRVIITIEGPSGLNTATIPRRHWNYVVEAARADTSDVTTDERIELIGQTTSDILAQMPMKETTTSTFTYARHNALPPIALAEDAVEAAARAIFFEMHSIMHDHGVHWHNANQQIWRDAARAALATRQPSPEREAAIRECIAICNRNVRHAQDRAALTAELLALLPNSGERS